MDTSTGPLIGRPYGGVAILWRKEIFDSVTIIKCTNDRIVAIRANIGQRAILVFSVYMPTDSLTNLPIFTDVLGEINAIIDNENVESVFILGDFNAHPQELFYNELMAFCSEQSWVCADVKKLGEQSNTYTFM